MDIAPAVKNLGGWEETGFNFVIMIDERIIHIHMIFIWWQQVIIFFEYWLYITFKQFVVVCAIFHSQSMQKTKFRSKPHFISFQKSRQTKIWQPNHPHFRSLEKYTTWFKKKKKNILGVQKKNPEQMICGTATSFISICNSWFLS